MCWSDKTWKWLQDNRSDTWWWQVRVWNYELNYAKVNIMPTGKMSDSVVFWKLQYVCACDSLAFHYSLTQGAILFLWYGDCFFWFVWLFVYFIISRTSNMCPSKPFCQGERTFLAHTCTYRKKAVSKTSREFLFSVTQERGLMVLAPWDTKISASFR